MADFKSGLSLNGVAVSLDGHAHTQPIGRGTAFPSNPAVGQQFWQTDLGPCEWDGNYWRAPRQHVTFAPWLPSPYTITGTALIIPMANKLRIAQIIFRILVSTTNNASNYWDVACIIDGVTTVGSVSTSGYNPNTGYAAYIYSSTLYTVSSIIVIYLSKVGSPGGITISATAAIQRSFDGSP
jgi:hypothetical protein